MPGVERVAARFWPGPLTLVLPRRAGVDLHLGEPAHTIGLRVPDHELVRAVAERVGPIATTSANRHGEPTPPTAAEAAASLAGEPTSWSTAGGSRPPPPRSSMPRSAMAVLRRGRRGADVLASGPARR